MYIYMSVAVCVCMWFLYAPRLIWKMPDQDCRVGEAKLLEKPTLHSF